MQHVPNLRILTLAGSAHLQLLEPEQMIQGVEQCKQLTHLSVTGDRLTSAHLCALLSLMPVLCQLRLASMPKLESLHFLSASEPLQRSLTSLTLVSCCHAQLRAVDVAHIFSLQQLTYLRIENSFAEKLDSFTQHLLQSPSSTRALGLPRLTKLELVD